MPGFVKELEHQPDGNEPGPTGGAFGNELGQVAAAVQGAEELVFPERDVVISNDAS